MIIIISSRDLFRMKSRLFMIESWIETIGPREYPRSHESAYYAAMVKDTVEHIVPGRSDNFTAIRVRRSRVLAARGPRVKRVSQTRVSRVLHVNWRSAEGRNSVCLQELFDSRGYHWNGLKSSKDGGTYEHSAADVASEEGMDVPDMRNYFISSEIPEK